MWADLKSHLRRFGDSNDKLEVVRNRALDFLKNYDGSKASSVIEHCRRDENDVRQMQYEKDQMVHDEDFTLVYDASDSGQLSNVHCDDDEDWLDVSPEANSFEDTNDDDFETL